MTKFPCPYLGGEVELSDERERHIEEHHPDLLPENKDRIRATLADPDQVRRSKRFGNARLFAKWYDDLFKGKHIVVVVVSENPPERPKLDCNGLYHYEDRRRRYGMEAKLTFQYDRQGDILYINKRPPYPEQESEELGDEVIARLNPKTREIENLEVLFFSTRLLRSDLFELPVTADLRVAGSRNEKA
jgi:uncharacterized protein YuzE